MARAEEGPRGTAADGPAKLATLELVGERVCLDFVNSVDPRVGDRQRDYISSYADLVSWSIYASAVTDDEAEPLLHAAERRPSEASAVFERAIALREALYRIFTAMAAQRPPDSPDLDALRAAYVETLTHATLEPTAESYQWRWPDGARTLDHMLWPIIRSAVELLTSPAVRRVKVCPGLGDCGWLFLDTSKSGRRRWCSMESCGSRSKMRRYYARTHPKPAERREEA